MANADSSWETSVVKLAQAGNSRAIAFWMNRYLVPQGICAQVATEATGYLQVRIVCRQVPDSDRIVRFICHRLCKLDSDMIRQVHITAQLVGSPAILWEKSARILPPSERQASQKQSNGNNLYPFPQIPDSAEPSAPVVVPIPESTAAQPVQPSQSVKGKGRPVASLSAKKSSRKRQFPAKSASVKSTLAKSAQTLPKRSALFSPSWQTDWQHRFSHLRTASLDLTDRSLHWFTHQKPATRAFMLGGSAVAAFLIGCSFELVGYYADPSAFSQSKATLTGILRSVPVPSGSVKTAADRVSIIRQPVLNPEDPSISLVFSNRATLTRLSPSQLTLPPATDQSAPAPLVTNIETYRLSDMLITNLDNPLSLTPAVGKKETKAGLGSVGESDDSETRSAAATDSSDTAATDTAAGDVEARPAEGESSGESSTAATPSEETGEETAASDFSDDSSEKSDAEKKAMPLMPQELLANGVDVVNIANDAVMADGASQLTDTLSLLQQNNIHAVGAGQTLADARRPQVFEVKGKRIAYLGYSDSSPHAVGETSAGVNVGVSQQMAEDIKAIRDQVDWIVVNFDWNRELRAYPEDWQVSLAHAAIDQGADLVVGYHPTVTQGGEIYNGRAIVYSLGDSIDEYNSKQNGDYDVASLKVTLKDHMMELEFLPIQVRRGQAEVAKGDLGTKILQYVEQASSLFDHPLRSPTSLNSQLRLSLPSAPDTEMPTDPFISYPESPIGPAMEPKASP